MIKHWTKKGSRSGFGFTFWQRSDPPYAKGFTLLGLGLFLAPFVFQFAFGWDTEVPFRPWPRLYREMKGSVPSYGLAFMGFFMQMWRVDHHG